MNFRKNDNLDTELNLVPIIDCFVMLICFLLFTAAFTQLVFLEAKITANTAVAMDKSRNELDKFHLAIHLDEQGFQVALNGSLVEAKKFTIDKKEDEYDFETLHQYLVKTKTQYPDRLSIDIGVKSNTVKYDLVLQTIDMARHLTDDEYSQLRTAGKLAQNLELNEHEQEFEISEEMMQLAQAFLENEEASKTDRKALFPDISLTGI